MAPPPLPAEPAVQPFRNVRFTHFDFPQRSQAAVDGSVGEWRIRCDEGKPARVEQEVFDPAYGVSKLVVRRMDSGVAPLGCVLSDGRGSAEIVVPVLGPAATANSRYSFLAYSCSEPFSTTHEGILARDLSLWWRMERRARGEDSQNQLPLRPEFVLGLGDQVYVDPDPDAEAPLAFFRGRRSNEWLIDNDTAALRRAFNIVYRYNFSLPPIVGALSKLPSIMMWDDHEIRDGWGSQGDEDTPVMRRLFGAARHAFIANQLLRSYGPGELGQAEYNSLVEGTAPLHRQFSPGSRTHVLMLDSRSNREITLFDVPTRSAVENWLARGREDSGDLYVLGVGVPLFPTRRAEAAAVRNLLDRADGLGDDLMDGWGSERNREARDSLLQVLARHFSSERNRDDRLLVLSGDVHYSSLYYLSLGGRVVGQEIVTSGIAHSLPGPAISATTYNDVAAPVGEFGVTPAGKITQSASFAEVIVDASDGHATPNVDVVLHTNGGFDDDDYWFLANTHLMSPPDLPLWYYPYQYNYDDLDDHLEAIPADRVPAGAIVPLQMEMPELKTVPRIFFWRPLNVASALLPHSVFCVVPGEGYNSAKARSWSLERLWAACVPKRDW